MINYIESKDNPKIKNALKIASDASFRKKNGMFFASSSKAVGDIARAGFEPVALFLTGEEYERQGKSSPLIRFMLSRLRFVKNSERARRRTAFLACLK